MATSSLALHTREYFGDDPPDHEGVGEPGMHDYPMRSDVNNVILVGNDGVSVHGHRPALTAGSPVLKILLTLTSDHATGWAESRQSEIHFPGFSSRVLLPVVKYLEMCFEAWIPGSRVQQYRDRHSTAARVKFYKTVQILNTQDTSAAWVESYMTEILEKQDTSWEEGFEVILAARFFLISDSQSISNASEIRPADPRYFFADSLEEIVWYYLLQMALEIFQLPGDEDLMTAAYALSFVLEFKNLRLGDGRYPEDLVPKKLKAWTYGVDPDPPYTPDKCTEDVIAEELVRILSYRPLEPLHLTYLSLEALKQYLETLHLQRHTRDIRLPTCTIPGDLELAEYIKLRQVLLWCFCQVSPHQAIQVANLYFPDVQLAKKLLDEPARLEGYQPPEDASEFLNSILLTSELHKNSLASLLSQIRLWRIPPELVRKIVEPMDVIPSKQISDAYSQQRRTSENVLWSAHIEWVDHPDHFDCDSFFKWILKKHFDYDSYRFIEFDEYLFDCSHIEEDSWSRVGQVEMPFETSYQRIWNELPLIHYKGETLPGKGYPDPLKSDYTEPQSLLHFKVHYKGYRGLLKWTDYIDQMDFNRTYDGRPDGRWTSVFENVVLLHTKEIFCGYSVFEWDVVIETPKNEPLYFPEIGFEGPLRSPLPWPRPWRTKLLKPSRLCATFWAFKLSRRGQCMFSPALSDDHSVPMKWYLYGKRVGYLPRHIRVVRVHLDMSQRSCAFYYRGDHFATGWTKLPAWTNMPRGGYLPAIRFSGPLPVIVRLEGRGFN